MTDLDWDKAKKHLDEMKDRSMSRMRRKIWIFARVPKTLNQLLRMHWRERTRDLESWKWCVLSVAGARPKMAKRCRVELKITAYRKALQDPDNAVGSCKNLIDALTRIGWLVDDSPAWLHLAVTERIDRKEPRTEVEWEELGR